MVETPQTVSTRSLFHAFKLIAQLFVCLFKTAKFYSENPNFFVDSGKALLLLSEREKRIEALHAEISLCEARLTQSGNEIERLKQCLNPSRRAAIQEKILLIAANSGGIIRRALPGILSAHSVVAEFHLAELTRSRLISATSTDQARFTLTHRGREYLIRTGIIG